MAQYGFYFTKEEVAEIAEKHGWSLIDWQESIYMVSFGKTFGGSAARINVYLTKMTVATSIDHPKKGKTQLFRRHVVTEDELKDLFANPRKHTGKGYYLTNNGSAHN